MWGMVTATSSPSLTNVSARVSFFPALVPRLVSVDVLRGLVMVIKPVGYGHGLAFIYVMWILAVAILYLPCVWFMELRRRHRDWAWLSYL